jgi:hypothetical protein
VRVARLAGGLSQSEGANLECVWTQVCCKPWQHVYIHGTRSPLPHKFNSPRGSQFRMHEMKCTHLLSTVRVTLQNAHSPHTVTTAETSHTTHNHSPLVVLTSGSEVADICLFADRQQPRGTNLTVPTMLVCRSLYWLPLQWELLSTRCEMSQAC